MRATFIDALSPQENFYEANVLVWASLDALGSLWARALHPHLEAQGRSRRRLGDFLARHGGDAFERVSLPALWARSDALDPAVATGVIRDRLRAYRGRRVPDVLEERQMRTVSEDPPTTAVLADLADIAAHHVKRNTTVADLVLSARFGELASTEMRCAIVHEGRLGERAHAFDFGGASQIAPTYLSGVLGVPPTIGFSPRYMVSVLRSCIDGFERDATSAGVDPVPPVRGCIVLDLEDES